MHISQQIPQYRLTLMNQHRAYSASFPELFRCYWRNRGLIRQMTRRDVAGRYRGSIMGLAWSFFNPVLMLTVYTFVFSFVLKVRWAGGGDGSSAEFAIILFVGMIVHGLFAECVNRAPGLILAHGNFVKKVVFPLEILPFIAMGSTLFHTAISLAVLLMFYFVLHTHIHWTIILLPLTLSPLIAITLGVTWVLASLGVFVRDIGQSIGIFTTVLLFLSPVFYPLSSLPAEYQFWLHLNPLTFMIEEARDVLLWGRLPDWVGLGSYAGISLVVAWIGFWWFQKTRRGFADVI